MGRSRPSTRCWRWTRPPKPPAPPGRTPSARKTRAEHEDWYRKAAAAGITLNAGRGSKLRQKRHALATRLQARQDDYLRFARDLRIPFTNNPPSRSSG